MVSTKKLRWIYPLPKSNHLKIITIFHRCLEPRDEVYNKKLYWNVECRFNIKTYMLSSIHLIDFMEIDLTSTQSTLFSIFNPSQRRNVVHHSIMRLRSSLTHGRFDLWPLTKSEVWGRLPNDFSGRWFFICSCLQFHGYSCKLQFSLQKSLIHKYLLPPTFSLRKDGK